MKEGEASDLSGQMGVPCILGPQSWVRSAGGHPALLGPVIAKGLTEPLLGARPFAGHCGEGCAIQTSSLSLKVSVF